MLKLVIVRKEIVKSKKISKEREELLNQIKGWYWDGNENAFTVGFMALEKFYKKNNTSMMDSRYIDENNFKLEFGVKQEE